MKEKLGGSGDPEVEDAVDIVDYFTKMFGDQHEVFQGLLESVLKRLQALDPKWTRPRCIQEVPDTPGEDETVEFMLAPWMLGFLASDSVKGKSKMSQITKCLTDFLEKPYASSADPLDVLMPRGLAVGATIPAFSVRHSIGFAKSLTARLILFATVDMRWQDSDMRAFQKELQALFAIKCIYSPGQDAKAQIQKSIGGKFVAAERQRPDIIQITYSLRNRALDENVDYAASIERYVQEYQEGTVSEGRKMSDLEVSAVKLLPMLTDAGVTKLEYHWQQYPVETSAIPLSKLATPAMMNGTKVPASSVQDTAAQALWTTILAPSPEKREAVLARRIGVFIYHIKDASRLKKKVNLRFGAEKYRCNLSDDAAYEVPALFTHWAPAWQQMLTPESWQKLVLKFVRGGMDTGATGEVQLQALSCINRLSVPSGLWVQGSHLLGAHGDARGSAGSCATEP